MIVSGSNFRGDQPWNVGQPGTLSGFGTNDMAGNVKEWCLNEGRDDKRFILGGGYGEAAYMYTQTDAQSPWDRRSNVGFRCVRLDSSPSPGSTARLEGPLRDYWKEQPVSDEVFRAYKSLFTYDKLALDARVDQTEDAPEWTHEKVTITAAYGGERLPVHLYIPKQATRPRQVVVYFPGAYAFYNDKFNPSCLEDERIDFIPRSGRVLVYPIYRGTYERADGLGVAAGKPLGKWRDRAIAFVKDLGRTLDYLESRPDMDVARTAYFGFSAGGALSPMFLVLEPRLKAAVLRSGGLWFREVLPEVDWINFVPRVRTPLLMLNGRYDDLFPSIPPRCRTSAAPARPTRTRGTSFTMTATPFFLSAKWCAKPSTGSTSTSVP